MYKRQEQGKGYNPKRGAKVIEWARRFLDDSVPLKGASWMLSLIHISEPTRPY